MLSTLTLAALCISFAPGKDLEVHFEGDSVAVPLVQGEGHIAVELTIGGKGPYRFNVDTYASCEACIDDDLAKELGLEVIGSALNSDGSTVQWIDVVRLDSLELGGIAFTSASAVVDDYDWVQGNDGEPVHGLLGFALFRELLWTIDYPGQRLVFERGELDPDEEHVIGYTTPRGAPDVLVTVNGEELSCGIDTGSQAGLYVDLARAREWGLEEGLSEVGRGRTAYSEFAVLGGELPGSVGLAGHELTEVPANFAEDWSHPLIGYGLLKDFAVTFDPGRRRVRIAPPAVEGKD